MGEPVTLRRLLHLEIGDALYPILAEHIAWNAPDHEYTRRSVRMACERALDEAFAVYEAMGGDASQGLTADAHTAANDQSADVLSEQRERSEVSRATNQEDA